MDDDDEIDFGEDYKIAQGDFSQALHNELSDKASLLNSALNGGDFYKSFRELFNFIQPVGFKLIPDVPDKSRLDIPVDVAIGF